jgi:hypothetical protein
MIPSNTLVIDLVFKGELMLIHLVSVVQSFKRYSAMIDCIHALKVVVPLTNRLLKERLL